jgi:hypothetical protein
MNGSIDNIADAIAQAEGYGQAGAAPTRYNNPGDLSKGDEWGQSISGYTTLPDGEDLIIFASPEAGRAALLAKLQNIANGGSRTYSPDMTWAEIAQHWAGNSGAWASNVTRVLGVSQDSTFAEYLGGCCGCCCS